MKIKKLLCFLFAVMLVINSAGCARISSLSTRDSALRVGVEGLAGSLNPFYCDNETDEKVLTQIFQPIQREDGKGGFVNLCGGITYEKVESGIKYTVNIRDDLMFSDGTHATIDDVIAFYYFIADATYDGKYSDWHLNKIQGLNEYYYDDPDYAQAVNEIEASVISDFTRSTIEFEDFVSYLTETKLDGKWSGNIDDNSPYGVTWRQIVIKADLEQELADLGETPSADKLLNLVAQAEVSLHPSQYSPDKYWHDKLYADYIAENYADGIDVQSISGIKKINDYACTVLFTQADIDAASQINVFVASKAYYFAEYKKGNAEAVKGITTGALGCGPYAFRNHDTDSGKLTLVANNYSYKKCGFDIIEFIETPASGAANALKSGTVDVIEIPADANAVSALSVDGVYSSIFDQNCYYSFFFNAKALEAEVRSALMRLNDYTAVIEGKIGKYYTALHLPMNIKLYGGISSGKGDNSDTDIIQYLALAGYSKDTQGKIVKVKTVEAEGEEQTVSEPLTLDFYYRADNDGTALAVAEAFKKSLEANGITVNAVAADAEDFNADVASGKTDVWFGAVIDTPAGDKYNFYHSSGRYNYTGTKDTSLDSILSNISALPSSQRSPAVSEMLDALMLLSVEMPVYQRKTMTAYNLETVDKDSIPDVSEISGFEYSLCSLKSV